MFDHKMCQLPLHHKYQPSSSQYPSVMMNSSSIRFKLLEVNYLQVSILTIKVFLTYLTYFNQNYFLHSNILCTWDWVYIHIPILLPNNHFPLFKNYKKLHHNTIQTITIHYTYYFNAIKIISLTQIYYPLNIFQLIQVHTLNTTYQIIYLNTLWVWVMFTYPFYSPMAISPCSKNYITTQFKLFHYTYYFNQIKIISLTQIYFQLNIFQQQSIH